MGTTQTPDHRLDGRREHVHTGWGHDREPILSVDDGDVVRFECPHDNGGLIEPGMPIEELATMPFEGHELVGPVHVDGASPGDVLEVELLEIDHGGWGYTLVRPEEYGLGLLPDVSPDGWCFIWDLDGDVGRFVDGIEVPLDPFPGVVGVRPEDPVATDTMPPRRVGGNVDVKHLTVGSCVRLPIEVPGAMFSVGDGHAAQGDGEVCLTAIETPLSVTARFTLHRDRSIRFPRFTSAGPFGPGAGGQQYGTMGVGETLHEATVSAIREMIEVLSSDYGLSRVEAYVLCSVAVDLKINEVVSPNRVVSAYLPADIPPG